MKDLLMQFINVTYFLYLRLLEVYFYCICVSLCREWCESRGWKSCAKVKATGHGRIPEEALPIIVEAHGSRHCGGGRPWEIFKQKQTIKLTFSVYRWTVCQSERRIMIKVVHDDESRNPYCKFPNGNEGRGGGVVACWTKIGHSYHSIMIMNHDDEPF